jgi:uncharacterized YccA/Bax inhibitor family protein
MLMVVKCGGRVNRATSADMSEHLTMRSGNPVLTTDTFRDARVRGAADTMTIEGTVNKTGLALLLVLVAAT